VRYAFVAEHRSVFSARAMCRCVIIELFSRRVVGWSAQSRMTTDLALQALLMAVWRRKAGAVPVIPYKSNRRDIPRHFAKALCRGRARIEQMIGKLKRFKRVALRSEKTARNFRSIIAIAAAFILIKSVHTT
jgi:transposase InsO family protein